MADFQEYVEYESEMEPCVSSKSKVATGLLAIFLGQWGVDQFYLGKIAHGFISVGICVGGMIIAGALAVIITVITMGFGVIFAPFIGSFVALLTMIWPIIRAIQAFAGKAKDANGDPVLN